MELSRHRFFKVAQGLAYACGGIAFSQGISYSWNSYGTVSEVASDHAKLIAIIGIGVFCVTLMVTFVGTRVEFLISRLADFEKNQFDCTASVPLTTLSIKKRDEA